MAAPAVQAGGEGHRRDVGQLEQDRLVDADGENPAVRRIEGQPAPDQPPDHRLEVGAGEAGSFKPPGGALAAAVPGSDGGAAESTGATFCPSDLVGAIRDAEDRGLPPEGWPWHAAEFGTLRTIPINQLTRKS